MSLILHVPVPAMRVALTNLETPFAPYVGYSTP